MSLPSVLAGLSKQDRTARACLDKHRTSGRERDPGHHARALALRRQASSSLASSAAKLMRKPSRPPNAEAGTIATQCSRRARKGVVEGKSLSVVVDLGGRRIIEKKQKK